MLLVLSQKNVFKPDLHPQSLLEKNTRSRDNHWEQECATSKPRECIHNNTKIKIKWKLFIDGKEAEHKYANAQQPKNQTEPKNE